MLRRSMCLAVASTSSVLSTGVRGTRHAVPGRSGRRVAGSEAVSGRRLEDVVLPVKLSLPRVSGENVGAELAGPISKADAGAVLLSFSRRPNIRTAALEHGLSDKLFHMAFVEFRSFCRESETLPTELHIKISDIINERAPVDDLYPFFIEHARKVFPHLECMEDLRSISDLTQPHNWYNEARNMTRRIIFHCGPTNSGKTHHALEAFNSAKTGVYCGPLKLLATEVYHKTTALGVPCDLTTGDERKYAVSKEEPANHLTCTVEMLDTARPFEVAIIDEIQMVRDLQRGWAWTRALLGVCAEELHLCGEAAAVDLIRELLLPIGEEVEVKSYKRITPLRLQDEPVGSFKNMQDGDCVVCFNKKDIYNVSRAIEGAGKQVAVVYGSLPPATKLAQAQRFNDPKDPCKVMLATDAIGMGLNLHIRRVVFYSLLKPKLIPGNEGMDVQIEPLQPHEAKQIGGRAGRFGTAHSEGLVTTFRGEDLKMLHQIWNQDVEQVEQAGLRPTLEQIEMFAFHLPQASLTNLLHIFLSLVSVNDSNYFICGIEDTLFLANMIEHVKPLPLRVRYTFCLAPINRRMTSVCAMFLKFARRYSRGEPITAQWFMAEIGWPRKPAERLQDLAELESVYDMMEAYLWLSFRFPDMFVHPTEVRQLLEELDCIIREGVGNIVSLMKASESAYSTGAGAAATSGKRKTRPATPESKARTQALMSEVMSLSDMELELQAGLRAKETSLVLDLVGDALRLNKGSKRPDAREMARIMESIAQELESLPEAETKSPKFPVTPSLRSAVAQGWLAKADLANLSAEFKKKRRVYQIEHQTALKLALKSARAKSDS